MKRYVSNDTKMWLFIVGFSFLYFIAGFWILGSFTQSPLVGGLFLFSLSLVVFATAGILGPRIANKLGVIW